MQILINGLISGSAIALLAVAFQAVYLPTRVFFIGLAGVYATAPFVAHACRVAGWPWFAAIGAAITAAVSLALFFEWVNHGRLSRRKAGDAVQLISSLGLYIATVQTLSMVWGSDPRTLRSGLDDVIQFGDVTITGAQSASLLVAVGCLVGYGLLLRWSNFGLRLRAIADNSVQFALLGYNGAVYRYVAFGVSGALAAAASLVTAYDVGFGPHVGLYAVLLAIVAVIVGGPGSFLGPALGGLLVGLLRAQVVWHFSPRWVEAATFALLALFLLLRPQGLFGRIKRLEASGA